MSKDEIREIAQIVGGDKTYRRFVKRINKEFEDADEVRNADVYVVYIETPGGRKIGFSVIGKSPAKMRLWQETFRQEGWVPNNFIISKDSLELMYMYVKPHFRSKGYGERLFKKTISYGRIKRAKEVYAYVGDKTSTALDFYKDMKAEVIRDFSDEDISSAILRWKIK